MKKPALPARQTGKPATRRKTREELNQEARARKRQKKQRGNTAGSRTNTADERQTRESNLPKSDPRIGSKKPIPLVGQPSRRVIAEKPPVKPARSPQDELALLENDVRLDALLERLDRGDTLEEADQRWMDQMLTRIDELMSLLGITLDDEIADDLDEKSTASEDIFRLLKGH